MNRDDARRLRRRKVVMALRRRRVVREMRRRRGARPVVSEKLREMQDNLLTARTGAQASNPRSGMDNLLKVLDAKRADRPHDSSRYAPKIKTGRKPTIRIVVEDLNLGCEHCLSKPALIFSPEFDKNLCLDCEELLMVDAGAVAFDKLRKKATGGAR